MTNSSLVISYLTLRKIVGLLGTSLPFVLIIGAFILFDGDIRSSISGFYYTGMRDVFVGTMCVIGFFLLSYRGYERADDLAGDLCCGFAVGLALFPTAPEDNPTELQTIIGWVHLAFAALFFITLIYFCLFLFTKSGSETPTPEKLLRNKVYKACGYIMGACVLGILAYTVLPDSAVGWLTPYDPVFWLEGTAVVAFGISWLTKGEAILADAD